MVGVYNDSPNVNPLEVDDWRWVKMNELLPDIAINPHLYTAWFKIIINKYSERLKKWKLQ